MSTQTDDRSATADQPTTGFRSVKHVTIADLDWHAEHHDGLWLIHDPTSSYEPFRVVSLHEIGGLGTETRICPIVGSNETLARWRPSEGKASNSARLAYDRQCALLAVRIKREKFEQAEKSYLRSRGEYERARREIELIEQGIPRHEQRADQQVRLWCDMGFLADDHVLQEAARRGICSPTLVCCGACSLSPAGKATGKDVWHEGPACPPDQPKNGQP